MITKMTGRTYDMLDRDKRVRKIKPAGEGQVTIMLQIDWEAADGAAEATFDNWEDARNWVRKAVLIEEPVK